jgi:hypothetical protein
MAAISEPPRQARRGGWLLFGAALLGAALSACDDFHERYVRQPETAAGPVGTPLALFNFDLGPSRDQPVEDTAPAATPAEPVAAAPAPVASASAAPAAPAAPAVAAKPVPRILLPEPVAVASLMTAARNAVADGTRVSREVGPGVPLTVMVAAATAPDSETLAVLDHMRQSREVGPGSVEIVSVARAVPVEEPAPKPAVDPALAAMATIAVVKPSEVAALIDTTAPVPAAAPTEEPAAAAAVVVQPAPEPVVMPRDMATGREGNLTGLTDTEVQMLLGPPLSVRRDDPAEAWQYATGDCILDLFFYQDTGSWRVAHIEARTIAALDAPADACVKSVLAVRLVANGQS